MTFILQEPTAPQGRCGLALRPVPFDAGPLSGGLLLRALHTLLAVPCARDLGQPPVPAWRQAVHPTSFVRDVRRSGGLNG